MSKVMIPTPVLDTIDGVACEPLEWSDLSTRERAERYCDTWIHTHPQLEADEQRVRRIEDEGASEFEAQRRVAAELSAEAWAQIGGVPAVAATPLPRFASPAEGKTIQSGWPLVG